MQTLLTTEIVAVENGVLLTIKRPASPSVGDPLAQRSGFEIGPTYYPTFELATAAIPDQVAVYEARKALKV